MVPPGSAVTAGANDTCDIVPDMHVGLLGVDGMVDSGYALVRDVLEAANILAPRLQLPQLLFRVTVYGLRGSVTTAHGSTLRTTPWKLVYADRPDVLLTPSLGQVRVDQAVHLLRTTDRSLDRIAQSVGYRDATTLRNLIRRRRGTTVSELRRRTPEQSR